MVVIAWQQPHRTPPDQTLRRDLISLKTSSSNINRRPFTGTGRVALNDCLWVFKMLHPDEQTAASCAFGLKQIGGFAANDHQPERLTPAIAD